MESVAGADAVAGGAAETGAGGVVSRPRLFRRLGTAQVTVVSAPAASGKTVLLRSWISTAGLEQRTAWVPAGRGEREPQRFWLSVLAALRRTGPGALLVRVLTAAPHLDGWALVERLLKDLAPLDERVWLVIDDVHELGPEVLQQLGLHRLRLEGQLAEIRRSVRSRRSSGKVPQPLPVIPRKVAELVLQIAAMDNPPLRLLVGTDAVTYAAAAADARAAADATWRELSITTDHDDVDARALDPLGQQRT